MDVVTVTRASCAQPLDFYQSLLLMLLTFKAVSDRALRVARWLPASGGRDTLPADLTRTFCSTTLYTCTPVSSPLRLISALSTPPPPVHNPMMRLIHRAVNHRPRTSCSRSSCSLWF